MGCRGRFALAHFGERRIFQFPQSCSVLTRSSSARAFKKIYLGFELFRSNVRHAQLQQLALLKVMLRLVPSSMSYPDSLNLDTWLVSESSLEEIVSLRNHTFTVCLCLAAIAEILVPKKRLKEKITQKKRCSVESTSKLVREKTLYFRLT